MLQSKNAKSAPQGKEAPAEAVPKSRRYLIFTLGEQQYGVPLGLVKEVVGLPKIIPVPNSPEFLLGLFNLRGKVIPAVDLKVKLKTLPSPTKSKRPALILTDCATSTVGFSVDSINEVLPIETAQIDQKTEMDLGLPDDSLSGVARFSNRPMILILDLMKVLDKSDYSNVNSTNRPEAA